MQPFSKKKENLKGGEREKERVTGEVSLMLIMFQVFRKEFNFLMFN